MNERLCAADHHSSDHRTTIGDLQVCSGCASAAETALVELPQLYLDLLDPSRVANRAPMVQTKAGAGPKASKRKAGEGVEGHVPLSYGTAEAPGPGDVRALIRDALDRWTLALAAAGIQAPRPALYANRASAEHRVVVHMVAAMDATNPEDAETHVRSMLTANRAAHLYSVDLERHDPITGGAVHLRKQLDRLLKSEHASDVVRDLTEARRLARSRSNPNGPPAGRMGNCPLGDCGGTIQHEANTEIATCTRCGTSATIDWWWTHRDGADRPTATADQLSLWLSCRYRRSITTNAIRVAASRGHIKRAGQDDRGRTMFDVGEAQAHWDQIHKDSPAQQTQIAS